MKKHKKELSLPLLLLINTGVCVAAVILSSLVFTFIASLTKDPGALVGIFALTSLLFAGAVSGFSICKALGNGGALIAYLSVIITALFMSAVGLIVKGGSINVSVFLNYLAYIGIGALFAFIATRKRTKKKHFK